MASSMQLSNAKTKIDDVISVTHLTECQLSQINSIKDCSWDFTHLPAAMKRILVDNPNHCGYFYLAPSSCDASGANAKQALVMTVIMLPELYGPPTLTTLRYNNQRASESTLLPFESLGYSWKEMKDDLLDDPLFKGKLFHLACEADTDTEFIHDYEYATPYLVSDKDLRTNENGKLCLEKVSFSFEDGDGDVHDDFEWDCSVNFEDYINEVFDEDYKPLDEDIEVDEAAGKAYLRKVISKAAKLERAKKEDCHSSHFKSVKYTPRQVNKIKCYVILPTNYPASIHSRPIYSGRSVDAFLQQQQGGPIYISHHYSLSDASLRNQLPSTALTNCDIENENERLLHMTLILDFADAIRHEVNDNAALDALVRNYAGRILQYIGSNLNRHLGVQYLLRLVDECKGMISKEGRFPSDARDFITKFLFNLPKTRNGGLLDQEKPQLIRKNSSWVLEVKCFGGSYYRQISIDGLRNFLSDEGIISSILSLLCGSNEVMIAAGAREDLADAQESTSLVEQQPRWDCFKQSLLLVPWLTESCKLLIEKHLPDHEVPFSKISELLEQEVKTVVLKRVRADIHQKAMTAACTMVGVFLEKDGNRQHCVFIDGTDGTHGTITDPLPEYKKRMDRCAETLELLGITEFSSLFEVKSVKVNKKTKRKLKKTH